MAVAVKSGVSVPDGVRAYADLLGSDRVRYDSDTLRCYQRNTSALSRDILAVLTPQSAEEVQQIVRLANTHRTPLYPVSCGKNWGLGSRLPVQDGAVIVDLSRMNRIHDVSVDHGYAVVEPGVTQGQLHQHLLDRAIPLVLNVTGAGTSASIIGNALERGVGCFSARSDALSGLEIVLGNGERLSTGFGHYAHCSLTHLYRPGIGPSLDGLFAQSNFGIVTRAGVNLLPAPARRVTLRSTLLPSANLLVFVDALSSLVRAGVIDTVVRLGNRVRSEASMAPLLYRQLRAADPALDGVALHAEVQRLVRLGGFGRWNAVCGLSGEAGALRATCREIRRRLRACARTTFVTDRTMGVTESLTRTLRGVRCARDRYTMIRAMRPLYDMTKGVPSDAPLDSVVWAVEGRPPLRERDPDQQHAGMLSCLPFIPMDGACAQSMVEVVEGIFRRYRFPLALSLNFVERKVIEFVISIPFDKRDAAAVERAHACLDATYDAFMSSGHYPYRVGIESMGRVVNPEDPYWHTVRALKRVMDPNGIIAPGRYSLH